MKFLVCPQCGIDRFFVLNKQGNRLLVKVNRDYEIVLINPEDNLDGFDLDLLYCLGCSWKGSKNRLVKYLT
jgi:hypothetical protein